MMLRRKTISVDVPPAGFRYISNFIASEEAQRLIAAIEALPFERVMLRGYEARREVVHIGARYSFDGGSLSPAPGIPDFLDGLCRQSIEAGRLPEDAAIEALVTRYPPGARIGWHRDAPPFGPVVVGISLASVCELRLRLPLPDRYEMYKVTLEPCSLYVISGAARFHWQHAIPPVTSLRYSVTFRTIK